MSECCIGVGECAGHGHAQSDACRERETTQHPIVFFTLRDRQGANKIFDWWDRIGSKKEQTNGVVPHFVGGKKYMRDMKKTFDVLYTENE